MHLAHSSASMHIGRAVECGGMHLLAQGAPAVVRHVFLWQLVAVGCAVLLALLFVVGFLAVAFAGFRRDKSNIED